LKFHARNRLSRAAILAALVFLLGCQATPGRIKPVLDTDGELFVYLAPLSQEANRLKFRLTGVSALREDGTAIPLAVLVETIRSEGAARERILASGALPPGRYAGLRFQAADASLKGEEGTAALRVPEEGSRSEMPFTIARRRGTVLLLSLRYADSIQGGLRFVPSFAGTVPGRSVTGLTGFVTSRGANTVTAFDKITGRVSGVIPTGSGPSGMALDQSRRKLYVALTGDSAVEVVDVLSGETINRLALFGGDEPVDLALTPDGRTLLSVNSGSNTVSLIDPGSLIEEARLPVGNGPGSIVVDGSGRRAFVLNATSDTVSVVDIPGRQVAATFATEAEPVKAAFNRDGSRLYIAHRSSPWLSVIDPVSFSVTGRIYVGTGATALKVDTRTDRVYIARRSAGRIEIFDAISSLPSDFIPAEGDVSDMAIDGESNNLFVVLPETGTVKAVRMVTRETAAGIDVGEDPARVKLMGER